MTWFDYLYYRVMERFKGVNEVTLEAGDMEDLLKKNEYLDIQDFVQDAQQKDVEKEQREAQAAQTRSGKYKG